MVRRTTAIDLCHHWESHRELHIVVIVVVDVHCELHGFVYSYLSWHVAFGYYFRLHGSSISRTFVHLVDGGG